jgi:two-component system sensor histidine kinase TctE
MGRREPRLKRALLAGLLAPLVALLVLDTAIGWWTAALADHAYDRGLHEIAREVALHVHEGPSGPRLDLSPAAKRRCWSTRTTGLRSASGGAGPAAGRRCRAATGLAAAAAGRGAALLPRRRSKGESVRVVASWLPYDEAARPPGAGAGGRDAEQAQPLTRDIVASLLPRSCC